MTDPELLGAVERALAKPLSLAPLIAEWAPNVVLGLPWYAALTVRASSPDVALRDLLLPDAYDDQGTLGLHLQRSHPAELVADAHPSAHHDDHVHRPSFDLRFGEARRTLVDLSPLVPTRGAAPDAYSVIVRYAAGIAELATASQPLHVQLRAATPDLLQLASSLRRSVDETGSWLGACERWVESSVESGAPIPELPPAHPLALPVLVATCRRAPGAFAKLPPARFAGWDAALEPDVRRLYIEWLIARREIERAEAEAFALRERTPGLRADLEALGLRLPPVAEAP